MSVPDEVQVAIRSDVDIVLARQHGRALATRIGFSQTDAILIATAISELARNIVSYAKVGEITMRSIESPRAKGMVIIAHDNGPGIRNTHDVLRDGYSTSGGLGLGLPGVRRLMDEFNIESEPAAGTTVTIRKWRR